MHFVMKIKHSVHESPQNAVFDIKSNHKKGKQYLAEKANSTFCNTSPGIAPESKGAMQPSETGDGSIP